LPDSSDALVFASAAFAVSEMAEAFATPHMAFARSFAAWVQSVPLQLNFLLFHL
jgi:hypothetical protein